jgi:Domain of unknown function (DUF4157)
MTHRRQLIAGLAASAILPRVAGAQAWSQQFGNVAIGLLVQWITASRQQALAAGTEPVPPLIVQGMAGYFQPGLEQAVRWRSTGTTEFSLPGLAFQYGDAAAITLIDVVLFRSDSDGRHDLKLWAHEMTHVEQYRAGASTGSQPATWPTAAPSSVKPMPMRIASRRGGHRLQLSDRTVRAPARSCMGSPLGPL